MWALSDMIQIENQVLHFVKQEFGARIQIQFFVFLDALEQSWPVFQ